MSILRTTFLAKQVMAVRSVPLIITAFGLITINWHNVSVSRKSTTTFKLKLTLEACRARRNRIL
ncbi:hypothetical protein BDR04DRAFT_1085996 [Suillus decipiens]|nr:hypothetical protein BDR04DRAFT_1085996 [Suillus decipiens]